MGLELRPGIRRIFRVPLGTPTGARRDLDEELEMLITNRVEHLIARGMSPDDARAEALRRLGAHLDDARLTLHTSAQRRERRMRFSEWMDSVKQDIDFAVRGLIRRPGFTAVAVLTIAIGVGATTAIFSAVNVLVLRPLPYARPDELTKVSLILPAEGAQVRRDMSWSYPMVTMFRDAQRSYSDLAMYAPSQVTLTGGDVERINGEYVSASYLRVLGLSPSLGRDFEHGLDTPSGAQHEAIISYALWQRRFNASPSAIGGLIAIDVAAAGAGPNALATRAVWTIIGVAPPEFRGLSGQADILLPIASQPAAQLGAQSYAFFVIGRRAPGVTAAQAAGASAIIGAQVANAYPNPMGARKWQVAASPLDDARLDPAIKRSLLVLFGAVWLVLLIACVNVANLLLGRASARTREIAVRMAIGAGRARLARLLLTESLVLALVGAVASVALAWAGVRALATIDPSATFTGTRPAAATFGAVALSSIALDWRALAFTFLISLVVGVLFGLAPAVGASRASLGDALKSDRRAGGAGVGRRTLVVAEVALAVVLLAGSGLMVRSLANLLATYPGFDGNDVLTFRLALPSGGIGRDSMPGFYSAILDRVRAVPGVMDAALNTCTPLGGSCVRTGLNRIDAPIADATQAPYTGIDWITPNWFAVMHVPLERGRLFTTADRADAPKVVLLNETAAKTFFGTENPIGKHISLGFGPQDGEVIGIVGGARQRADSAPGPVAYVPYAQAPRPGMIVFVRASKNAASIGGAIRRAVHEVAPQLPVFDMLTMTQRTSAATAQARFRAVLLTAFAITALSLAAIGIYGVMSFSVAARTREIGVRIALGAEVSRVQRLIIGEGMGLVSAGGMIGLAGAFAATRVLRTYLFDLTPNDPAAYAIAVAVLATAAWLASWIPARRASRVDPVVALRTE